jgi:hypothetical protein
MKAIKLSDKILLGTIAGLFMLVTIFMVWFRLNIG